MASVFTSYFAKDVGTSASTLTTVASATTSTVVGLSVANTSAADITVDIYITRSAVNYYVIKGATVPVGSTFVMAGGDQKINMIAADALKVITSAAASADAMVSVLELS
jgi:hypothetical protein